MEKQIKMPTAEEFELIDKYVQEQDFWKSDTANDVIDLFLVLVGYGLDAQKAINNIASIVNAMKNEYGEWNGH